MHYFAAFCLEISNLQETQRNSLEDASASQPVCLLATVSLFLPHPPRRAALFFQAWESPREPLYPRVSLPQGNAAASSASSQQGWGLGRGRPPYFPDGHNVRLADSPQVLEVAATCARTQRPSHVPGHRQGRRDAHLVPTLHSGPYAGGLASATQGPHHGSWHALPSDASGARAGPQAATWPTCARAPRPPRREGCVGVTLRVPRLYASVFPWAEGGGVAHSWTPARFRSCCCKAWTSCQGRGPPSRPRGVTCGPRAAPLGPSQMAALPPPPTHGCLDGSQ